MKNKIAFITGSTDGIGKQTAIDLAGRGFDIILHGRNENRCIYVKEIIKERFPSTQVDYFVSDFSSMVEVNKLADKVIEKFEKIDVHINNAGVYMNEKVITVDGFETTFAVNHLAMFVLTKRILELVKNSDYARIINVSSIAHNNGEIDFDNLNAELRFDSYEAYAQSKLANILFTYKLTNLLSDSNVTVNCLHPGVIDTKLLRAGFNIQGASLKEGASTSVFLAESPDVKNVSGKYFVNSSIILSSQISYDRKTWDKLWDVSENLIYKII